MATSPFELFRRNLKPLMIALTALAMFAFVVLPALQSYQQMNRPGGPAETTVANYEGGTFEISQINYFNRNHSLTLRFLSALAERTMERGGTPQVPGFFQDPRSGSIQGLGINSNVSRESAVTAQLFAEKAETMGLELDDAALRSWLDRFVDSKLTPGEINAVLTASTENQLGQFQMYEQLRTHLLASAAQQVLSAGLFGGNQLTIPPAKQFDLFRRLNQQAVVTAYPVLVDDFLDQVSGEPTEAEIEALYEEGKERYPSETTSEPAFRRPATRAFEYVTADVEKFIEQEVEEISEEELRAEYEERKAGGAFRLPEMPAGTQPAEAALPQDATPADATPSDEVMLEEPASDGDENAEADAATDEDAKAETPAEQPGAATPESPEAAADSEAPAEKAPAADAPAENENADGTEKEEAAAEPTEEPAAAVEEVEVEETETPNSEDEGAEAADGEAEPEQGAARRSPAHNPLRDAEAVRMVAFRPQDESEEPAAPAENEEPAETPAADPSQEGEQPGEPAEDPQPAPGTAEQPAEQAPESADEPQTSEQEGEPTAEQPSEPTGAEPAEAMQDEAEPAADATAPTEQQAPVDQPERGDAPPEQAAEPTEPQVQPFEEVRDEIARQLARPAAIEKAQAATRKVHEAMRTYFTRKAIHQGSSKAAAEPPVRPDLQAMADELGLEYVKTEPLNETELQNHPLGNTATRGGDMQMGERFPNLVFGGNVPVESPVQTESLSTRAPYVSWIISATDEEVPPLSEIRDEVVEFWRRQQARDLAEQAARDLATKANESEQPLTELVPQDRQSLVAEDVGPFPWMLWLGPGRRPIEWSVQELDRTGEAFMRQVFHQPLDQYGVAPNEPKTVYYTVKTTQRTPDLETLRERFMQATERRPVSALASDEIGEIQQGFIESFQDEIGLEWTSDQEPGIR